MSLDYPILPICQTAESFRNILSAMGPYRDSISLKKSPFFGPYTGSEAQLDLATVRYHALGAYAKSVYLVSDIVIYTSILNAGGHTLLGFDIDIRFFQVYNPPRGAQSRCPKENEDRTTNARKSGSSHRVGPPRTTPVTKSDQTVKEWRG